MRIRRLIYCFFILLAGILVIAQPAIVLAQDETTPLNLEISAKYPKVEITSGEIAVFEVELKLQGGDYNDKPKVFDLTVTAPKNWLTFISPTYPQDKKIASIELAPGFSVGEKINVRVAPPVGLKPEPGEYPVTLEAKSGELAGTYELTTLITAKYVLDLVPTTGRFNTPVTAGKDNFFSIEVQNNGSASIDEINLSSNKPEGWTVDFEPRKVDSLAADDFRTVDINIKPAAKTIAGDYIVTISASGSKITATDLKIRVTVETPTVWGWVGVIIVLAVIAALFVIFRRFSRR